VDVVVSVVKYTNGLHRHHLYWFIVLSTGIDIHNQAEA
jgi:hypothetical protein